MPGPQLHYWPGACSLAPHVILYESGLPFEAVKVSLTSDFRLTDNYHNLNPKMKVPILVLGNGAVVTEITAVMTAIAQMVPDMKLLGKSDIDTVRVYEWMNWLSGTVHSQVWGAILRPERFINDIDQRSAVKAKGVETAKEQYQLIEKKLGDGFAVGDDFTIVEPFLYVLWLWAFREGLVSKETHPKYAQLVTKLSKRPSMGQAIKAEGIDFAKL